MKTKWITLILSIVDCFASNSLFSSNQTNEKNEQKPNFEAHYYVSSIRCCCCCCMPFVVVQILICERVYTISCYNWIEHMLHLVSNYTRSLIIIFHSSRPIQIALQLCCLLQCSFLKIAMYDIDKWSN